ncbi:hypothetical protein NKG94_28040 [Micromonospora sp. M12]
MAVAIGLVLAGRGTCAGVNRRWRSAVVGRRRRGDRPDRPDRRRRDGAARRQRLRRPRRASGGSVLAERATPPARSVARPQRWSGRR